MIPIDKLSDEQKQDIKRRLEQEFGSRLAGVVLYGSMARGDAEPDSDIDILVLLKGGIKLGDDLERIIEALFPLELTLWRPFHGLPVAENAFADQNRRCYEEAREEGIRL